MQAKTYMLLERCIEDGIMMGLSRAYKHTDTPDDQMVKEAIHEAVMQEIGEWFFFDTYE
jgi:hypothetical protein